MLVYNNFKFNYIKCTLCYNIVFYVYVNLPRGK